VDPSVAGSRVRLAELLASLSLATDLGLGQPTEHVLRSCTPALNLGEDVGLDGSERAAVYYVALLAWLGCHADSHEQAAWFGDDIALRAEAQRGDRRRAVIGNGARSAHPVWALRARVGSDADAAEAPTATAAQTRLAHHAHRMGSRYAAHRRGRSPARGD
jgi:hypothetical protein